VKPTDCVTSKFLAGVLGRTDRRVRQLAAEEGMPRCKDGQSYPLAEAVKWFLVKYQGTDSLAAQLQRAQRRKLEIDCERKEETLIDRDVAIETLLALEDLFREALLRQPAESARGDKALEAELRRDNEKTLGMLRRHIEAFAAAFPDRRKRERPG
jgi:hypothetical protein